MCIEGEHFDQSHKNDVQHWHCAVSTVDLDGNHVSDKKNYERLREVERQIEEEFDLVRTHIRPERERNNLPTGEYRMKARLEIEQTPTEKLWQQIREVTHDQPTFEIMAARLKAQGIGVQFKEIENEIVGISFEIDGALRRGRDLGKQYSFAGLQRNEFVLEYESSQTEQLRQVQSFTPEQCQQFLETQNQQQQHQNNLQREHDRLHQEYTFAQQKPRQGSVQWSRAKEMLHYIDDRINQTDDTDLQDDRFLVDWNEETRRLTIAEKGEAVYVIVQGEPKGEADWEVLHADVSSDAWQYFQDRVRESVIEQHRIEMTPTQSLESQSFPPEVSRPQPSDSIEQKQQFYGQLWQHYNQGLRPSLPPFERDVAIAQKAMGERSVDEARYIVVRGPEAQSYIRAGNREGAFSYVDRVVATAQENQLSPEQRDRGRLAAKVIDLLLKDKQEVFEGRYYLARYDAATQMLTLSAKNGRGEILRKQGQFIVLANLNAQDQERFSQAEQTLQHQQSQSPPTQTQKQLKPPQREIER
ncbi:mobilization protein [Leptolyngbya sp. NIES-2104]|nr:mobilization protein [Leptolyngbya sp. NIES-2104]